MTHAIWTSTSHPLYVNWVPALPGPLPGRLGLTLAPGKKGDVHWKGYQWQRDLDADLAALRDLRVDRIVCLLEPHEFEKYGITNYDAKVRESFAVNHFPIRDGGVARDIDGVRALVAELVAALVKGESIAVHCAAGLGRTGTIVGCVLVDLGIAPADALITLKEVRGPGCPENHGQREFVRGFAR